MPPTISQHLRYRSIKRTTLISALVNILFSIIKIAAGWIGHSSALVADGLHSFSDLLTDALVLIAAKAGMKGPDTDHPYGHQRIETLATTLIATIFIAVGFSIAYHSIQNLLSTEPHLPLDKSIIIVAIGSIVINEWLFRYTIKVSKAVDSALLASNAWHHRSDALSSVVVFISMIGTIAGIAWLDLVGAIIIAALIIKMGSKMIWDNLRELVDTAVDEETTETIKKWVLAVPGTLAVHQVRSRTLAGQIYLDLHLIVDNNISVSEGHHIGEQVETLLKRKNSNIKDITVHIDPEDDEHNAPSVGLPNRIQVRHRLEEHWGHTENFNNIQRINIHYLDGRISLEIYFKVKKIKYLTQDLSYYRESLKDIPDINALQFYIIAE